MVYEIDLVWRVLGGDVSISVVCMRWRKRRPWSCTRHHHVEGRVSPGASFDYFLSHIILSYRAMVYSTTLPSLQRTFETTDWTKFAEE